MTWLNHRKQAVCDLGFNPECVQHCRLGINDQLMLQPDAQVTRCWKAVREVVVPLRYERRHLGVLFLGAWRSAQLPTNIFAVLPIKKNQRKTWQNAWHQLPVWSDKEHGHWLSVAQLLAEPIAKRIAELVMLVADAAQEDGMRYRIRQYFLFHYRQPISLHDLASHINRSVSRTGALVREMFSHPFALVLRSHRCEAAKYLLRDSDILIKEISLTVGYDDPDYFARCFLQETGFASSSLSKKISARKN